MTSHRAPTHTDDHAGDGESSTGWSPDALIADMEASNGLLDELHALKYGEQPRGLGWAWNDYEDVRVTTVIINGKPYLFDPLTRELRERKAS